MAPPVRKDIDMLAYAVFFTSFAVYLCTSAPLVTAGDAGELTAASFLLGVPHPPGYPLECLLGKAASLIPLGCIAGRVALMSSFFSAAAVAVAYLLIKRVARVDGASPAGAAFALAAGFSGLYWGLATVVEVYPTQMFLGMSGLYFLAVHDAKGDDRWAYVAALTSGLAVAAHYTTLVMLPGMALYLVLAGDGKPGFRRTALIVLFFTLGLSAFMYLPPRAYAATMMDWGSPDNLDRFIGHITRAGYGDLGSFSPEDVIRRVSGAATGAKSGNVMVVLGLVAAGLFLMRVMRGGFRVAPVILGAGTLLYLVHLLTLSAAPFKWLYLAGLVTDGRLWLILVPAAFGAAALYIQNRRFFLAAGLIFASLAVVSIFRIPVPTDVYKAPLADKFFTPCLLLGAVFAGAAAERALALIKDARPALAKASALLTAVCFIPAVVFLATGWEDNDHSRDYFAFDYSDALFNTMEEDAAFLALADYHAFLSVYQKAVEDKRPDVEVFEASGGVFRGYDAAKPVYAAGQRPIYCTDETAPETFPGVAVEQAGVINRFKYSGARITDPWVYYNVRVAPESFGRLDFMERRLVSDYYYNEARDKKRRGELPEAARLLRLATESGWDNTRALFNSANVFVEMGMPDEALMRYERVVRLSPGVWWAYKYIGDIKLGKGDVAAAVAWYNKALAVNPDYDEPYMALALMAEKRGGLKEAAELWMRYAKRAGREEDRALGLANAERLTHGNAGREGRETGN